MNESRSRSHVYLVRRDGRIDASQLALLLTLGNWFSSDTCSNERPVAELCKYAKWELLLAPVFSRKEIQPCVSSACSRCVYG